MTSVVLHASFNRNKPWLLRGNMFNIKSFNENNEGGGVPSAAAAAGAATAAGNKDFTGGMVRAERRGHLHALLLQVAIRVRYLFESWFLLRPLLSSRYGNDSLPNRSLLNIQVFGDGRDGHTKDG